MTEGKTNHGSHEFSHEMIEASGRTPFQYAWQVCKGLANEYPHLSFSVRFRPKAVVIFWEPHNKGKDADVDQPDA